MDKLTKTQRKVLNYCLLFLKDNDQLPPMSAIADNFGWASANAAQGHMNGLWNKGWIEYNEVGKYRFTR